jgi:radial spoke head protein 4/6
MEVQELKNLLQSSRGEKGKSLMDHLQEVFSQLIYDNPRDPLSYLELLSQDIKKYSFSYLNSPSFNSADLTETLKWASEEQKLIDKPKEVNEEGVVTEVVPENLPAIADIMDDRQLLRWAGVDLGEEECYRLRQALKKLVREKSAKDIRFWGKIYGTEKDYYVIEGVGEAGEEEERPPDMEKKGEGVNAFTYWVTDSAFNAWTELPDVTPSQIKISRHIRKLFTGNLNAQVVSNPHFPGKEKELLRAQIARITHSTYIEPKGLHKLVEDNPNEIENEEEPTYLSTIQLKDSSNWVHTHPTILKAGRITHMDPEVPDDADIDIEILKAQQIEKDPFEERLKPISKDKEVPGLGRSWVQRHLGDPQEYTEKPPKKGKSTYAYNVLKSLWWPGAIIVQQNEKWINFYLGNGLKVETQRVYPIHPPVIRDDPVDRREFPEPYPETEPEEPKPQEDEVVED